jgi:hypothetical protein
MCWGTIASQGLLPLPSQFLICMYVLVFRMQFLNQAIDIKIGQGFVPILAREDPDSGEASLEISYLNYVDRQPTDFRQKVPSLMEYKTKQIEERGKLGNRGNSKSTLFLSSGGDPLDLKKIFIYLGLFCDSRA